MRESWQYHHPMPQIRNESAHTNLVIHMLDAEESIHQLPWVATLFCMGLFRCTVLDWWCTVLQKHPKTHGHPPVLSGNTLSHFTALQLVSWSSEHEPPCI